MRNAQTYIQSGNVVFETDLEETSLQNTIYAGFSRRFGFESGVMMRNIHKIKALIDHLPFSAAEISAAETADPQVEHLYVCFWDHPPEQARVDGLCREYTAANLLRMGIREGYLLCHQSIHKSELAIRAAKEFDSAIVRNWKTVGKLYDMLSAL